MRPLLDLVPAHGWIPDFMEPAAGRLPGALDAVRAATAADVDFDLARIAAERRPPPTAEALAANQKQALDRLAEAVVAYHHMAVAPYWRPIAAPFDAAPAPPAPPPTRRGPDLLPATPPPS